ncbi:MAG: methyltransferase domain-containing protein [Magnetococcales bacterium]|nr:methyltransferase domain-containing protein [Magnetococcales bacterium]
MNTPVSFYQHHGILPGVHKVDDLRSHFSQREALFRQLGIVPRLLRDARILDIGPGGGYYALYNLAQRPRAYVVLDRNARAIEHLKQTIAPVLHPETVLTFRCADLLEMAVDDTFDLVICEAVIAWQQEQPETFLERVSAFVAPGGVLLITCMDSASWLFEMLRRLAGRLITGHALALDARLALLEPVFAPHLHTLAAGNRLPAQWVMTNLLVPLVGGPLSMGTAIATLADDFVPLGSAPHFLTDWSWYKRYAAGSGEYWREARTQYHRNLHNLLDQRRLHPPNPEEANLELLAACDWACRHIQAYETDPDVAHVREAREAVARIADLVRVYDPEVGAVLCAFGRALDDHAKAGAFLFPDGFAPLFGRTQQHLSFVRRVDAG